MILFTNELYSRNRRKRLNLSPHGAQRSLPPQDAAPGQPCRIGNVILYIDTRYAVQ